MFATDEHRTTYFFPWGPGRKGKNKGYILINPDDQIRIANIYTGIHLVYFITTIGLLSVLSFSWLSVEVFVVTSCLSVLARFLYARSITKSLKFTNVSFAEIAGDRVSPYADD